MTKIFDIINIPLGYVMRFLAQILGGNFAASVLLFTFLIDVVLIPLSIKSQKSTVSQMRIKPKLDELKKRYGDDKQKMAQAQQELYQKENVSMAGGCLPMIIRLVILFSIYTLILSPLTYMAGIKDTKVDNVKEAIEISMTKLEKKDEDRFNEIKKEFNYTPKSNNELSVIKFVRDDTGVLKELLGNKKYKSLEKDLAEIKKKDKEIDYTLFIDKIDLAETPDFNIDIVHNFKLNWLLPIGAFIAQILMSLVSMRINKINNPDAPSMMGMMLLMPLISLFIGFGFPGGVCFYWICSSIVGGVVQVFIQIFYGPQKLLARERAKDLLKECDFEEKQLEKLGTKLN